MDRGLAILATFAVGALVAFQPPANEQLGRHVGALGAALVSLTLSTVIVAVALAIAGGYGQLRGITGFRPEHAIGGIGGAAIVAVTIYTVRPLGAAGVAAAVIAGQLSFSLILDRLGLLGLEQVGLTPLRVLGIALLVAGVVVLTWR